jgi:hypothetical protein
MAFAPAGGSAIRVATHPAACSRVDDEVIGMATAARITGSINFAGALGQTGTWQG